MKNQSLLWGALFLLGIGLPACQRDVAVAPTSVAAGKPSSQDIQAHYGGFDWDNPATTTMPVSTTSPVVYVPWRSNGGTPLDPGIVDDYHKSDGWELVFNTFSPDNFPNAGDRGAVATAAAQPGGGLYFALYNNYRGIIRYYMYVPPGFFGTSSQLEHGLQVYSSGNTSKMLNFSGVDIVDANANATGFTTTNKDGIATTGGWYAMQYQIAYDPLFQSTTFPNPGFKWSTNSISITQIKLNGTEIGTAKGSITTPAPGINWVDVGVNGAIGIAEVFAGGVIGPGLKGFEDAAKGGLAGNTAGVLSGLFGGNSANTQTVDLTINSTITTTGTATSSQPYEVNSTPFPGQNVANTNGVPPLITHPIGLFNLSDRPTVYVHSVRTATSGPSGSGYRYDYTYSLDATAVQSLIQRNPSILNSDPTGATLGSIKAEVVSVDPDPDSNPGFTAYGTQEVIGTHTVYTGNAVTLSYAVVHGGQPSPTAQKTAVRLSFYVVPNSGASAPKPFIVKTFLANVVLR